MRTPEARQSFQNTKSVTAIRGPITKIGRKVFKVLVVTIASELLDKPLEKIVEAIERKHRQTLLWQVTPDNYTKRPSVPFTDWNGLAAGLALLVIHGIFNTVEGMLSNLPTDAVKVLREKYAGRVIAYNHLSVTPAPEENARWFLKQLKQVSPEQPIPLRRVVPQPWRHRRARLG